MGWFYFGYMKSQHIFVLKEKKMDSHTREILTKFGLTAYAQAILSADRAKLKWLVDKYGIQIPDAKKVNELVANIIAENFKK